MLQREILIRNFEENITKRDLNFDLYEEMGVLFNTYVFLKYQVADAYVLKLSAVKLIDQIGATFYQHVEIEDLLFVYPIAIRTHLLYYLVNDLHLDNKKRDLIIDLYHKEFIQNNEWVKDEWEHIEQLYKVCVGKNSNFLEKYNITNHNELITLIEDKITFTTELQRLWFQIFVEELNGKTSNR